MLNKLLRILTFYSFFYSELSVWRLLLQCGPVAQRYCDVIALFEKKGTGATASKDQASCAPRILLSLVHRFAAVLFHKKIN